MGRAFGVQRIGVFIACFVCATACLRAGEWTARENVERAIQADGDDPAAAIIETITWRYAGPDSASVTVSLLSGTYKIYASGELADDPVIVEIVDKSAGPIGRSLGSFVLSSGGPTRSERVKLSAASFYLVTVRPPERVQWAESKAYDIVVGLLRVR